MPTVADAPETHSWLSHLPHRSDNEKDLYEFKPKRVDFDHSAKPEKHGSTDLIMFII